MGWDRSTARRKPSMKFQWLSLLFICVNDYNLWEVHVIGNCRVDQQRQHYRCLHRCLHRCLCWKWKRRRGRNISKSKGKLFEGKLERAHYLTLIMKTFFFVYVEEGNDTVMRIIPFRSSLDILLTPNDDGVERPLAFPPLTYLCHLSRTDHICTVPFHRDGWCVPRPREAITSGIRNVSIRPRLEIMQRQKKNNTT